MLGKWIMDNGSTLSEFACSYGSDARTLGESDYDRSEYKTSHRFKILWNNQKYILTLFLMDTDCHITYGHHLFDLWSMITFSR